MRTSEQVLADAMKLPRDQRADVARALIASLDEPADADVEAAWLAEAERRLAAVESGTTTAIPWETVRQQITERLRAARG